MNAVTVPDDSTVNVTIRSHAVTRDDWDFTEDLAQLHPWADRMNVAFMLGLPQVVIGVDWLRITTLGHYRPGRNGFGLRYEIVMNAKHLGRPFARQLGTLCHELLHAWQELYGRPSKNNYHNKEFRTKAATLGLVVDKRGYTQYVPGTFFALLAAEGIEDDGLFETPLVRLEGTGRSKLRKYSCTCRTNFWAAVQVHAVCMVCESEFVLV